MRIPEEFVNYWKGEVKTGSCIATDPENNSFSLASEFDTNNYGFFTHGIRRISEFYGLIDTHKAYFKYVGNNCYWIRVFGLDGKEIDYPEEGFETDIDEPFLNVLLPIQIGLQSDQEIIVISSDEDDDPIAGCTHNSWSMKVKRAAVSKKNPLVIPARIVGDFLMNNQQSILIEDESKKIHNCTLLRSTRRETECYVGGDSWYKFCKEKNVKKGTTMEFTIADDAQKIIVNIRRG